MRLTRGRRPFSAEEWARTLDAMDSIGLAHEFRVHIGLLCQRLATESHRATARRIGEHLVGFLEALARVDRLDDDDRILALDVAATLLNRFGATHPLTRAGMRRSLIVNARERVLGEDRGADQIARSMSVAANTDASSRREDTPSLR